MKKLKIERYAEISKLAKGKYIISFMGSLPDSRLLKMYYGEWEKATKSVLGRYKDSLMQLSPAIGGEYLREQLNRMFGGESLVVGGAQQGLEILAEILFKPNDVILLEPFSYIGIENPMIKRRVRIKTTSLQIADLSIEKLESEIKEIKPKALYIMPFYANPTGQCIDIAKLKKIRDLARRHKFYLIEDQTYGWYAKIDDYPLVEETNSWVIRIGSISKLIGAGLRVGWILMNNSRLLKKMIIAKETSDLATSSLDQAIVADVLSKLKELNRWREKIKGVYNARMNKLCALLKEHVGDKFSWQKPSGGIYLWLKGSGKIRMSDVGILCVPGSIFSFNGGGKNMCRLSISAIEEGQISDGMKWLVGVVSDR